MADVKWIKLSTGLFDDEKIKLIKKMPDGATVLIVWMQLLIEAGKKNDGGYVHLSHDVPYNDEMLATVFDHPLQSIRLAIQTFEMFKMIEKKNGHIYITNWDKYQNIEGMDKIKDQWKSASQKYRLKQKQIQSGQLQLNASNNPDTRHMTTYDSHKIEVEEEVDKEKDKEISTTSTTTEKRNAFEIFEDNYQKLTVDNSEKLKDLITEYTEEKVIWALNVGIERNVRNLRYVEGTLESDKTGLTKSQRVPKKKNTPTREIDDGMEGFRTI